MRAHPQQRKQTHLFLLQIGIQCTLAVPLQRTSDLRSRKQRVASFAQQLVVNLAKLAAAHVFTSPKHLNK
jgi:hypothetical protein